MTIHIPQMPSPSADALSDLECWLGQRLPMPYAEFVRNHDGAEPQENSLMTKDGGLGVSRFIPINETKTLAQQIEGFPVGVVPFAEDSCGNYFYVEPISGSVCFWDHEVEGDDEVVASNVSDFIVQLMPIDVPDAKLKAGQAKRVWANPSFKPEF